MIPLGYISGQDRNEADAVAHLYKGTHQDPCLPMCARGWNRGDGYSYSIFRGSIGSGICRVCMRRALAGKDGVPSRPRKTKWI